MLRAFQNVFRRPSSPGFESELRRMIHLAFELARKSGRSVALGMEPGRCRLAPRFHGAVSMGVPEGVPLPTDMLDPRWAAAPRTLRVSPWHTATEGMWFLRDAKGPLCMHLTARGDLRFLRFQVERRQWCEIQNG